MSRPSEEPWFVIRKSPIHNEGVFASRDIPKDTRIIEYLGEKISKAESNRRGVAWFEEASKRGEGAVYLFILNKRFDIDGNVPWNPARLINHSCAPNCEAQIIRGRIWLVALRAIPEGTELSFNYGFDLESWEDHPCRCGSAKCIGYIAGKEYWGKLRKILRERDEAIAEASREAAKAEAQTVRKAAGKRR